MPSPSIATEPAREAAHCPFCGSRVDKPAAASGDRYASNSEEQRQSLHLRVASALEDLYGLDTPEQTGLIAIHSLEGGQFEKAYGLFDKLGDIALAHGDLSLARYRYQRAHAALERLDPSESASEKLVDLVLKRSPHELYAPDASHLPRLEQALRLARELGSEHLVFEVLFCLSRGYHVRGEHLRALEYAAEGQMLLDGRQDTREWGRMQTAFGRACLNSGRYPECLDRLTKGLPLLASDDGESAASHGAMALALGFLGRFSESEAHSSQALVIVQAMRDTQRMATVLTLAQFSNSIKGDWEAVKDLGAMMQNTVDSHPETLLFQIGVREVVEGYAHFMQGWFDAGHALMRRGMVHMEETKLLVSRSLCSAWLAEASALIGLLDEAEGAARYALEARARGDHYAESIAHRAMAIVAAGRDQINECEGHFERSLDAATRRGERPHAAVAHYRRAECLMQSGRTGAARDALTQASAGFVALGMGTWSESAQRLAV